MKLTIKSIAVWVASAIVGFSSMSTAYARPRRGEIGRREHHQARRIHEGVKSGELTKQEARELRHDERGIRKEVREERKENGGRLTAEEKKEVNHKLNQESKEIREMKHNEAQRPKANQ